MTKSRISLIIVSILFVLVFIFSSSFAGGMPRVSADAPVEVDAGPATLPINPIGGEMVFDNTPRFYFSQAATHTDTMKYRIDVWNFNKNTLVYSFKGKPTCVLSKCWFDPTTTLKYVDITETKGLYYWVVQAKTGDDWSLPSDKAYFKVMTPGFDSAFTALGKWLPIKGTWSIVDPGYLLTQTKPDKFLSVLYKHQVTKGYKFEVRMKRKGEFGKGNYVIVNGYPYNGTGNILDSGWDDGYMIGYSNLGYWFVKKRLNGAETQLIPNTNEITPAVVPYKWNRITVFVRDSFIYVWINEQYLGKAYDENLPPQGWVGIGADDSNPIASPLYVDWAELEYVDDLPYPMGEPGQ